MLYFKPNQQHETIVKIQRPVLTNDPQAPWLCYGQHHSNMIEVPARDVPEEVVHQMGEAFRAFFWGTYRKNTDDQSFGWFVTKRTHDRNW